MPTKIKIKIHFIGITEKFRTHIFIYLYTPESNACSFKWLVNILAIQHYIGVSAAAVAAAMASILSE